MHQSMCKLSLYVYMVCSIQLRLSSLPTQTTSLHFDTFASQVGFRILDVLELQESDVWGTMRRVSRSVRERDSEEGGQQRGTLMAPCLSPSSAPGELPLRCPG